MKIVISDTSPIRALDHLGLLDLLRQFFGQIIVPPAVESELATSAPHITSKMPTFLRVEAPTNLNIVDQLLVDLEQGEAEAIALAIELGDALLLVDERRATVIARDRGLSTIGVLGLLLQAKKEGKIQSVADCIERLRTSLKFFLGSRLVADVLREAGELP